MPDQWFEVNKPKEGFNYDQEEATAELFNENYEGYEVNGFYFEAEVYKTQGQKVALYKYSSYDNYYNNKYTEMIVIPLGGKDEGAGLPVVDGYERYINFVNPGLDIDKIALITAKPYVAITNKYMRNYFSARQGEWDNLDVGDKYNYWIGQLESKEYDKGRYFMDKTLIRGSRRGNVVAYRRHTSGSRSSVYNKTSMIYEFVDSRMQLTGNTKNAKEIYHTYGLITSNEKFARDIYENLTWQSMSEKYKKSKGGDETTATEQVTAQVGVNVELAEVPTTTEEDRALQEKLIKEGFSSKETVLHTGQENLNYLNSKDALEKAKYDQTTKLTKLGLINIILTS